MSVTDDQVTWPEGRPYNEPDDGWVTAQQLFDTELHVTTLCRFAGIQVSHSDPCGVRQAGQHPDEECRAIYVQAEALTSNRLDLSAFDSMPEEIRVPLIGGDPIATSHR